MSDKKRLKDLGLNIKMLRIKQGLSQEELAEQVKISRNSISLIETGKINPTILKVIDITKALNVDINALIKDV
ncbi:MAG: helix-turn-helix transcriptional regulator [Cyanobacteria bacterium SIG28]|nr:helix-turn-helix transcriptional regulator [Cyanobacteria bacterium SIG28]